MRLEPCEQVKIDLKDKKILELVVKDGRMPFTEMAKKIMLSKDAVSYRIKRLQSKGVIKKFTAIVDYKAFGHSAYNVFLQTREVTEEKEEKFLKYLDKEPHIVDVIDYSDAFDFHLKIIARTIEKFNQIIQWIKEEFSEMIDNIIILPVVEVLENSPIPRELGAFLIPAERRMLNLMRRI